MKWVLFILFISAGHQLSAQKEMAALPGEEIPATPVEYSEIISAFRPDVEGSTYFISLCADLPHNKKPWRVAFRQQTGHVFLILQQIHLSDTINQVFGFYPKKGLPTLFFKNAKSILKDNSKREYEAYIKKEISPEEFSLVLLVINEWKGRVYHINRFNCYDYALGIFNQVAGKDSLPILHLRFPFIFGKGGTPVSLFRSLKDKGAPGNAELGFGEFTAPVSSSRQASTARSGN